ncbi:MAG: PRC-barrel domain-containing protein [Thiogranum sp.]|nr:PRC-barrel domain-containing protein [Thiogranum sp.]
MTLTKHALAIAISFAMGTAAYAAQDQSQQQPGAQTETGQERQGMMTTQPAPDQPLMYKSANDIIGMNVKNQNDEDIGVVENIVIDPDTNELYAVISAGGVLGIGDKKVPMELKQLELRDESLVSRSQLSEDELKNKPEYVAANYEELQGDQVLGHVAAAGPAGVGAQQFAELDTDGDGVISQQEAQDHERLKENWQSADMNNDQQINRAEFSAFEERQKQEHGEYKQPGQMEQQEQQ